jgi:hypothetical protein
MDSFCVTFVCNFRYLDKFFDTCKTLIDVGEYYGPIVLIVGNDINVDELNKHPFLKKNKQILVKHFPDIVFCKEVSAKIDKTNTQCGKFGYKLFQYHKYHLFTPFFKQWRYVFYIDCGAKIYDNIEPILRTATPDTLLAHSDAYPTYQWKLGCQFLGMDLNSDFDLNSDYFQSTIMLFDTSIIEDDTFQQLYELTEKYPVSTTNDQGILNLYFNCIKKKWKQIPMGNETTYFYDFNVRNDDKPYIMTKYYVFND